MWGINLSAFINLAVTTEPIFGVFTNSLCAEETTVLQIMYTPSTQHQDSIADDLTFSKKEQKTQIK